MQQGHPGLPGGCPSESPPSRTRGRGGGGEGDGGKGQPRLGSPPARPFSFPSSRVPPSSHRPAAGGGYPGSPARPGCVGIGGGRGRSRSARRAAHGCARCSRPPAPPEGLRVLGQTRRTAQARRGHGAEQDDVRVRPDSDGQVTHRRSQLRETRGRPGPARPGAYGARTAKVILLFGCCARKLVLS